MKFFIIKPKKIETLGDLRTSERSPTTSLTDLSQPNAQIVRKETPTKISQLCSPLPKIHVPFYKRGKQSAELLTTKKYINSVKLKNKNNDTSNIVCRNRHLTENYQSFKKNIESRFRSD